MSSRPRRGSCSEYFSSISGAATSSTTPRLTFLPQNWVNQRPTTALFRSLLMELFLVGLFLMDHPSKSIDDPEQKITFSETASNSVSCFEIEVRGKDHPRRLHVKGLGFSFLPLQDSIFS